MAQSVRKIDIGLSNLVSTGPCRPTSHPLVSFPYPGPKTIHVLLSGAGPRAEAEAEVEGRPLPVLLLPRVLSLL